MVVGCVVLSIPAFWYLLGTMFSAGISMTLSELANIGEFLGGMAVIASLVYLAIQIRQNTKTVRGTTLQQNTDFWGDLFLQLADPGLTQVFAVGMPGRSDITPSIYLQFHFIARAMFLGMENQYFQFRNGILDSESYLGYEKVIRFQLLAYRGFRIHWEQNRFAYSPAFVSHIDALIETTPESKGAPLVDEWVAIATRMQG